MSRSKWKVPYLSNMFFFKMFNKSRVISLWERSSIISSVFVNRRVRVHNGTWLLVLTVKSSMMVTNSVNSHLLNG